MIHDLFNFNAHLESKVNKYSIGKQFSWKDYPIKLPCDALLKIYESFVRSHPDYGDIVYGKPNNESLTNKLETVQSKVCLAVTGDIQGTSTNITITQMWV